MSKKFSCRQLTPAETKLVTVPFDKIENESVGIKAVMQKYGFCIVADVASADECKSLQAALEADLLELIDKTTTATKDKQVARAVRQYSNAPVGDWPSETLDALGIKNRLQLKGLPHGRFAWQSRMLPRVRKSYEILHETDELVSSCDNSFVSPLRDKRQEKNFLWPHVDQNDHDSHLLWSDVYQGLLYCWPSVDDRSSTTVVWPSSHVPEIYDKYMEDPDIQSRGKRGIHFSPISILKGGNKTEMMDEWLTNSRRVPVQAGGLLLWSSRTTHQGWSGGPRLAQPVCWEPRERRSEAARKRKMALAALGLPSTHSASLGEPHTLVSLTYPTATEPRLGKSQRDIVLPLKPTIKSQALRDDINIMDVWDRLTGVSLKRPISQEDTKFLKSVIKDEYMNVL